MTLRRATLIGGIERAIFGDDSPREMQEFAGNGTAGDLRRFTRRTETSVESFERWVGPGSTHGRHGERCTEAPVPGVADAGPLMHAGA